MQATGTVIGYVSNEETLYRTYPVVRFNIAGPELTFTEKKYTLPYLPFTKLKPPGETVQISYNPFNPHEAQIKVPFYAYSFTCYMVLFMYSSMLLLLTPWSQYLASPDSYKTEGNILWGILGFALFCFCIYLWCKVDKIRSTYVRTTGTVTKKAIVWYNNGFFLIPEFKFYAENREIEVAETKFIQRTKFFMPDEGEQISVLYNPLNPKDAFYDTWQLYIFPLVGCSLVMLFYLKGLSS